MIVGYTFSHGLGDADILVVKTDESGNLNWSKMFGGAGTEYGNHILPIGNGYLITGYTTSFGAGSKDVYVVRIDREGNEIWSRTYGGKSWDVGMAACDSETGYLICGFTHSFGNGEEDIYVISIDPNGNELWSQSYGGRRYELGNSIYRLSDGNVIIGATTGTFGGGNSDVYLVKVDDRGNKIWEKSLGGQLKTVLAEGAPTPSDWCHQIKPASDGGFLIAGTTNAKDILNALVVKTDGNGDIVWGQVVGNSTFYDYGYSVTEDKNGNVLVIGAAKSIDQKNDIFLVKMDKQGELKWKKTIGSPAGSDWGRSIITTKAGEIILTGHSNSFFPGTFDVILAKLKMD